MWGNAVKVARLRGIDIKLDASWFLIAALLITLGALETIEAAKDAGQPAERITRLAERDMEGRARAMAGRLGATFRIFEGKSHGASIAPFLTDALRFLWTD